MFAGIGVRREVFGSTAAAWPRYQYMAAMLFAPVLAVGLDQARRFAPWAKWIPRLRAGVRDDAQRHVDAQRRRVLVGASPRSTAASSRSSPAPTSSSTVPPDGYMTDVSPDVQIRDLAELVDDGADHPGRAGAPSRTRRCSTSVSSGPPLPGCCRRRDRGDRVGEGVDEPVAVVVGDRGRQRDVAAGGEVDAAVEQLVQQELLEVRVGGGQVGRRPHRARATVWIVISDPRPHTDSGSGDAASTAAMRSCSRSPRAKRASSTSGVSSSPVAAAPAAIVTTLLLNVPPCVSSPPVAGSNAAMMSPRPPNAPNVMPPARYLPSVVRSGVMPSRACTPPALIRDVITSSNTSRAPVASHAAAQRGQELARRRDAAGPAHHRLDHHGGHGVVDRVEPVDVVELDAGEVERGEQRLAAVAEVEESAVVGGVHHHDPVAAGVVAGELDRHQVGLGARVGEPHLVDRREAGAHGLGEADLVDVHAAEAPPTVERGVDGGGHRRRVVPEQAGRVVAEEVDVLVPVDVDDP